MANSEEFTYGGKLNWSHANFTGRALAAWHCPEDL